MSCDNCGSDRLVSVSGKCSDMCNVSYKGMELDDECPRDMGIGGGDYIDFTYCLECGKIQDNFPLDDPAWYVAKKEDEEALDEEEA